MEQIRFQPFSAHAPTRSYLKAEDLEAHKDFIQGLHKAVTHKVILKRSKKEIPKEEVIDIMRSTLKYSQSVNSSPRKLIFSIITPNAVLESDQERIAEISGDIETMNRFPEPDTEPKWEGEEEGEQEEMNNEALEDLAATFVRLGLENQNALIAAPEDHAASPSKTEEDKDKELEEVISAGFSQLYPTDDPEIPSESHQAASTGDSNAVVQDRHDGVAEAVISPAPDAQEHGSPLTRYAPKAAEIVRLEWEDRNGQEPLLYHIHKQILAFHQAGEEEEMHMTPGITESESESIADVDANLLCQILEDNFAALIEAASKLPPDSWSLVMFKSWTVHMLFIISKYGLCHYFTARALNVAKDVLNDLIGARRAGEIINLSLLCVFDRIGIGTHHFALDCWLLEFNLELEHPELISGAKKAYENKKRLLLKKHGQSHLKTLRFFTDLAYEMVHSKVPETRQRGELLAFGIIQTLRATYRVYSSYTMEITRGIDLRGPVLYNYLDSTLDKLLQSFERAGKAKSCAYQELWKARKRGGFDLEGYANILAHSGNSHSQDYWYSQCLQSWLFHQDQDLRFGANNGGWVEEIEMFGD
ncbi:hypothetical protein TWF706_010591 [Orbilia oligospora]|nr:hypothetical protein TWF706_010591 [Orbilia oligospora]